MERFQVDRATLASMILANEEEENASTFFKKISVETGVRICWPTKLKPSLKKDPFIKLSGPIDKVKEAKLKIIKRMDQRNDKVTLKLDVSFTDHSHIIGRGGKTIQTVKESTGCHIHFPDSNRACHVTKSNQVTISGPTSSVEAARSHIRKLSPIVIVIQISAKRCNIDLVYPSVVDILKKLGVSVSLRTEVNGTCNLVVRGMMHEIKATVNHLKVLIKHLCESPSEILMTTEVAPSNHMFVLENLKNRRISETTNTQIFFPKFNNFVTIDTTKGNSTIRIIGEIDSIVMAREMFVDCLPVTMVFELNCMNINLNHLLTLNNEYNVRIDVKPRLRTNTTVVTFKTTEDNAFNLVSARLKLIYLQGLRIVHNGLAYSQKKSNASSFASLSSLSESLPSTSSASSSPSSSSTSPVPTYTFDPLQKIMKPIGSEMRYRFYDEKRSLAFKAMLNTPCAGIKRVPTSTWSGLGFSLSSKESDFKEQCKSTDKHTDYHKCNFNRSFGAAMTSTFDTPAVSDVSEWLWSNNLQRYIDVFKSNDVKTLEDIIEIEEKDLICFGIRSAVDRSRLMKLVDEIKVQYRY